jgi:hypothetical protein
MLDMRHWLGDGNSCRCGPGGHVHGSSITKKMKRRIAKNLPRPPKGWTREEVVKAACVVEHPKLRRSKSGPLWADQMRQLPCHYCDGPGGTIDHVIPQSQGGKTTLKNCVPACAPCNNYRRSMDYRWFKEIGWKTRPFSKG